MRHIEDVNGKDARRLARAEKIEQDRRLRESRGNARLYRGHDSDAADRFARGRSAERERMNSAW